MTRSLPAETKPKRFERHPLPPKTQKVRRALARTANGIQRTRQARSSVGKGVVKAYDWLGSQYRCQYPGCGQMVPYRRADQHNIAHFDQKKEKRKNLIAEDQKQAQKDQRPPAPRQPDRNKTRPTRGATEKRNDMPPTTTKAKPTGNAGPSNVPASSASAAIVKAFSAWVTTRPETHLEMVAHLKGMDLALRQAADLVHQFASDGLVARKIHPMCAKPVDDAADQIASVSHNFTLAVAAIEMIYRARLEAARQQGPTPDDAFFKEVG